MKYGELAEEIGRLYCEIEVLGCKPAEVMVEDEFFRRLKDLVKEVEEGVRQCSAKC